MITLINFVQERSSLHHSFTFILTKDPTLHLTFTLLYNLLDLKRQIKFTFPLNTREDPNCGFESWEVLPPSIMQIVLKGTHFLKTFAWLPHGHLWAIIEERLTYLILIIVFYLFWPKDHWEPCDKVGSLRLTER